MDDRRHAHFSDTYTYVSCVSQLRYLLVGPFLCSPCTHSDSLKFTYSGSLLKKQNTKYRLDGNSHQADISRVRTTHGDNIAISDDGIRLHMHTFNYKNFGYVDI